MIKPYQSRIDKRRYMRKLKIIRRLKRIRSFKHVFDEWDFKPILFKFERINSY